MSLYYYASAVCTQSHRGRGNIMKISRRLLLLLLALVLVLLLLLFLV